MSRGLSRDLAIQVADQLMAHDALEAHARDELGIHERTRARPIQAATLARRPSSACAKPMKTYSADRVCSASGCGTVLSTYNPASFCALHECAVRPPRRVARPVDERTCVHCAGAFATANLHQRYCSDRCRMAAFARRRHAAAKQVGAS